MMGAERRKGQLMLGGQFRCWVDSSVDAVGTWMGLHWLELVVRWHCIVGLSRPLSRIHWQVHVGSKRSRLVRLMEEAPLTASAIHNMTWAHLLGNSSHLKSVSPYSSRNDLVQYW